MLCCTVKLFIVQLCWVEGRSTWPVNTAEHVMLVFGIAATLGSSYIVCTLCWDEYSYLRT